MSSMTMMITRPMATTRSMGKVYGTAAPPPYRLLHLGRPVETDGGIVVGQALFVGVRWIVGLGGVVQQQDRVVAEHAIAVGNAGRDDQQAAVVVAEVVHVGLAVGGRVLAQVVED